MGRAKLGERARGLERLARRLGVPFTLPATEEAYTALHTTLREARTEAEKRIEVVPWGDRMSSLRGQSVSSELTNPLRPARPGFGGTRKGRTRA
jgi:hypothetical protein